jgi:integrase
VRIEVELTIQLFTRSIETLKRVGEVILKNIIHQCLISIASFLWFQEIDQVEVKRPDDQRDRYLSEDELRTLKLALDEKIFRKGTNDFNKTYCRLRLIVLIAVTTGMRMSEIFGLTRSDVMYNEGLLAVRAKLKGGKMRYVPMPPELADELRRFMPQPANNVLYIAGNNQDFRFHDLRHTFASWYMMNGGDLYELAKILGHSNIKMTERYAKLAKQHIARTSGTARELWKILEPQCANAANVG